VKIPFAFAIFNLSTTALDPYPENNGRTTQPIFKIAK